MTAHPGGPSVGHPDLVVADSAGRDVAVAALAAGHVVAIPTDTVYGLAVGATVQGATDRLFALKGRPRHVPLAVLVADTEQAWSIVDPGWPAACEQARRLATRYWPGALTLVVPRAPGWTADLGEDGGTVGVRCPDHEWVRTLCRQAGPLATTSANLHGGPTPFTAAEVAALLGSAVAVVVDGGRCAGLPSTVVDATVDPPLLLRRGALDLGL
jgi:tRNA threonylcarbamoyl adenosine modification protein (Sua5/YciO/YrdC/YwlC family)